MNREGESQIDPPSLPPFAQEKLPSKSPSLLGLRDKAFDIAKNPTHDGYQRGLTSMVYKFFDKKSASGSGIVNNNEIKQIYN